MEPQNRRQFLKQLGSGSGVVFATPYLTGIARAAGVGAENLLRQKIEHVVVIFQENRSFDHYFGTFQPKNGRRVVNLLNAQGQLDPRFIGLQKNPAGIAYDSLPPARATKRSILPLWISAIMRKKRCLGSQCTLPLAGM